MTNIAQEKQRTDLFTVAAIAAVVGVLSTQLHEAGGHGGACLALGQRLITWGAFYVECDTHNGPIWIGRVVAAAGSTANLIAALIAYAAFRILSAKRDLARWALWFVFTLNGFTWAGYYAFSGIGGIGDWGPQGVFDGVADWTYWRVLLAVGGAALYWVWVRWSMAALADLTGRDDAGRRQAWRLSSVAYWTNGLVAIAAGVFNPVGIYILIASAAASSLGGASGLLWGPRYIRPGPPASSPLNISRSWVWIAIAVLLVIADSLVLGPSLHL